MAKSHQIKARLEELTAPHNVSVLHAVESGSRAWGFASEDSDYDVRFIYVHPVSWYLSVNERQDTIELLDGDFDAGGWDLRKALRLMRKGNVSLLEWLGSPVIYKSDSAALSQLSALAVRAFLPESAAHHYLSMARKKVSQLNSGENRSLKAAFYGLRAALCARHIADEKTMAPVPFAPSADRYLSPDEAERVNAWLRQKRAGKEKDQFNEHAEFASLVQTHLTIAEAHVPRNPEKLSADMFDETFKHLLGAK